MPVVPSSGVCWLGRCSVAFTYCNVVMEQNCRSSCLWCIWNCTRQQLAWFFRTQTQQWIQNDGRAVQQQFTHEGRRTRLVFTFPRLSQSCVAFDSVWRVQTALEVDTKQSTLSELLLHVFTKSDCDGKRYAVSVYSWGNVFQFDCLVLGPFLARRRRKRVCHLDSKYCTTVTCKLD